MTYIGIVMAPINLKYDCLFGFSISPQIEETYRNNNKNRLFLAILYQTKIIINFISRPGGQTLQLKTNLNVLDNLILVINAYFWTLYKVCNHIILKILQNDRLTTELAKDYPLYAVLYNN